MNDEKMDAKPAGSDLNEIEAPGIYYVERVAEDALQIAAIAARRATTTVYWAIKNRPKLVHLSIRAKKRKDRLKNVRRIIREYLKEAQR